MSEVVSGEVLDVPREITIAPAVDTAISAQDEIIALRENIEGSFLELGRKLDDFITRDLHLAMDYRTVNEWLDSRALGIGRSAGWELINVWRTFGDLPESVRPELARAGHSKLALTAAQIGQHEEIPTHEAAIEYAIDMSYRELRRKFQKPRDPQEKVSCPTCGHKTKREKATWIDGPQVRGH